MKISKTIFKEYTRCSRVCALDDLYKKRLGTDASIYGVDDEKSEFIELLGSMFDSESGEDLIDVIDPQLQALLPYYNSLEAYAMQVATKKFGSNIIYNLDTKKQKMFAFTDGPHYIFSYLDGFQEVENEIRVFEVKATTSKKFYELGPKIRGKQYSIFDKTGSILHLKTPNTLDFPLKDFDRYYEKLFDRFSDVGKYVFDIAVERFIIEQSEAQNHQYHKPFKYYLVVLNNHYEYDGALDEEGNMVYNTDKSGEEIVVFIDMTEITSAYLTRIAGMYKTLLDNITRMDASPVAFGKMCERKKQSSCLFFNTCWQKLLEGGSILEYFGNHNGFVDENNVRHSIFELINSGYETLDSIPKKWLQKENNLIQRECYDDDKEYINNNKIVHGYKKIVYPIYHLDFESFPSPLPRFVKEKPYAQSVFQFSLHIEREMGKCDKNKDHYEYLAPDFNDHRLDLVKKMIEYIDLSNGGTVLVYNKNFEHTRIKEFANFFPEYRKELENINEHMFDLLDLVSTSKKLYHDELGFGEEESGVNNYYHNNLHGSYSIKKVLPVFSNLTYKGMNVANGTEAIAAYAKFPHLSSEDLHKVRTDLITYCKQDTWAMVVVLWGLLEKVGLKKEE